MKSTYAFKDFCYDFNGTNSFNKFSKTAKLKRSLFFLHSGFNLAVLYYIMLSQHRCVSALFSLECYVTAYASRCEELLTVPVVLNQLHLDFCLISVKQHSRQQIQDHSIKKKPTVKGQGLSIYIQIIYIWTYTVHLLFYPRCISQSILQAYNNYII